MGSASALEKTEHVPGSVWGSRSIQSIWTIHVVEALLVL